MRISLLKGLLASIMLSLLVVASHAKTYLFSSSEGDDNTAADSLIDEPVIWQSIDKLNELIPVLAPGDSVLFKCGDVFHGSIFLRKSGTNADPIYFGNFGEGPLPIIKGTIHISKWESAGAGIYKANLPTKLNRLQVVLIDGKMQAKGRFPNSDGIESGYLPILSVERNAVIQTTNTGTNNWTGAEIVIRKNQWIIDAEKITAHTGNTIAFDQSTAYEAQAGFGFFIQNHLGTLDRFGEWYFNPEENALFVHMGTASPENHIIEVAVQDNLVTTLANTRNIVIDGLAFEGANDHALKLLGGNNFRVSNSRIRFAGYDAIFATNHTQLEISHTEISDSFNNGITLKSGNEACRIIHNTISNTHLFPGMGQNGDGNGFGVYSISNGDQIKGNRIVDTGYSGISFRGNGTAVEENLIENYCLTKNDGGGIYTYTGSPNMEFTGRIVKNNIILHGIGNLDGTNMTKGLHRPQVEGIYIDDNASGILIAENAIAHVANFGVNIHNARNVEISHNLIVDTSHSIHLGNDERGHDIRGIKIAGNKLVAGSPYQFTLGFFDTRPIDSEIVTIWDNVHINPYGNTYFIHLRHRNVNGSIESNQLTAEVWQSTMNFESNAEFHIGNEVFYSEIKPFGPELLSPLALGISRGSINCTTGCSLEMDQNRFFNNNHLIIQHTDNRSTLKMDLGKLEAGTFYQLTLTTKSTVNLDALVYLRHLREPYTTTSNEVSFQIDTNENTHHILLENHVDSPTSALIFNHSSSIDLSYGIAAIGLRKVEAKFKNPVERLQFTYNFRDKALPIHQPKVGISIQTSRVGQIEEIPPFSGAVFIQD